MTILRLLSLTVRIGYYKWAMREIPKLHEDVPFIAVRLMELRSSFLSLAARH